MRIKKIAVKNLFGLFNHEIPLNTEEHITIIHGPNGYGKTMLLSMLNGLFNSEYYKIWAIPFDGFLIEFDNSDKLLITNVNSDSSKKHNKRGTLLKIELFQSNSTDVKRFDVKRNSDIFEERVPRSLVERLIPDIRRVGSTRWLHNPSNEILSFAEVLDRYEDILPQKYFWDSTVEEARWLSKLKASIDIQFIETQRLFSFSTTSSRLLRYSDIDEDITPILAIFNYSAELKKAIREKLADYASLSQELDSTFPTRLVKSNLKNIRVRKNLGNDLERLEQKRFQLISAGILEKGDGIDFDESAIDESNVNVLSVYVDDVEKKLGVFDELKEKVDLLVNIINSRFLHKHLSISKDEGFVFTSTGGKRIPPKSLSSGEQHELVLFYKLLFKLGPKALVLIDEPELSLHVVWQQLFLNDLEEITKLVGFDVLIATHSPQIINDRWDLTVELKGPEECEKS